MKIKKHIPLLLASLCVAFSFTVNAQSSVFIKGSDSTKNVTNGSVFIKSDTQTVSKEYNKVIITNGTDKSEATENPDNGSNEENSSNQLFGYVTAISGLNVRKGPGTNYDSIGALSYGAKVTILEQSNGWYKIKYNTEEGYVSATYVRIDNSQDNSDLPSTTGRIKKIVIDPGHGGSDPGAIGPTGLKEKDVVLNVSFKLKNLLESRGVQVVMTRTTDVYLTLQERTQISNNSGANFFLSVHANSFSNPASNGTETFSYNTTGMGAEVAKSIQNELIKAINLTDRGFKTANYYVIRYNNIPSSLVELAFISNPNEESLLASDAFQNKCAQAIAKAILNY